MPVINLLNACTLSLSLPIKLMPCRRIQKKTLVIVCEQNWIHIHSIVTTKKFGNLERGGGCSQSSKTSNNMHMKRQEMMKRWYEMEWSTIIGQEMSASIGQRSLSLLSLSYEKLLCVYYNNHFSRRCASPELHYTIEDGSEVTRNRRKTLDNNDPARALLGPWAG